MDSPGAPPSRAPRPRRAAPRRPLCAPPSPPPPRRRSEGGFFNAKLSFPKDYPNSPPVCRFTSEMWHPNGARDRRAAAAASSWLALAAARKAARGRQLPPSARA